MQNTIKTVVGVPVVQQYEKYLGLPSFIGRRKKESFDNIKQKVWKKLQGWEVKLLSQVGREILIKVVAQALPTYVMSCFKLPIRLCQDIEALVKKKYLGTKRGGQKDPLDKVGGALQTKDIRGDGFQRSFKFQQCPTR